MIMLKSYIDRYIHWKADHSGPDLTNLYKGGRTLSSAGSENRLVINTCYYDPYFGEPLLSSAQQIEVGGQVQTDKAIDG